MQVPDTGEVLQGKTMDVSLGGACVMFERNLPIGLVCNVFLDIPQPEKSTRTAVTLVGKVMNTALVGNISQFRIGIKFMSMEPKTEALLKSRLG